jgi:hypothetical protein
MPIQLEPNSRRPQLPPYQEISHPAIRDGAAGWDAARAALEQGRKDLLELEQTREASEWRDAELAETARAAGKPEPKRSHTAEHDRKIDKARHEHKITTLSEARAFEALQSALDEHQGEWEQEIDTDLQVLDQEWSEAVDALVVVHARRSRALSIRSKVIGPGRSSSGAVGFEQAELQGIELQPGQRGQLAYLDAGAVLGKLADLGMPEPVVETVPVEHAPPGGHGSPLLRGQRGVEDEIAERSDWRLRSEQGLGEFAAGSPG